LKSTLVIYVILTLIFFAGCNGGVEQKAPVGKELLSVDFQENQTLRYKFVSRRDIELNWGQMQRGDKKAAPKIDKSFESFEIIVAFSPIKVDPYSLSTIKATCESVKIQRRGLRGPRTDAVQYLKGKSYTFDIDAAGRIKDYSQLNTLIRETALKAFRKKNKKEKIKDADMVSDFIATQRFVWDAVSSIKKPVKGVSPGESWESKLWVPSPMVMRKARNVTYTLEQMRESEKGRIAVIRSDYSIAESVPSDWPKPYPSGRFQMKGTFGFLVKYKLLDLKGSGEELFNIDTGRIQSARQNYKMLLRASMLLPLGPKPEITIRQNLTTQLLDN